MNDRDWQMLTSWEIGDPIADIKDWMLKPYTQKDIEQWGDSLEKERAMERKTKKDEDYGYTTISIEPGFQTTSEEDEKKEITTFVRYVRSISIDMSIVALTMIIIAVCQIVQCF
jgi:hypothetical protein